MIAYDESGESVGNQQPMRSMEFRIEPELL